ncbi:MAG: hypothetical protein NC911_09030 [Candidatus Omnitrophica bacterium]|nr:hypothetical protein [Candidatus Omnitrophota bacterium]
MTCRERLIRVFKRQEVDRMPIRLWGVDPLTPRDDWATLYCLIEKYDLEMIRTWSPGPDEWPVSPIVKKTEKGPVKDGQQEVKNIWETPKGPLVEVFCSFVDGSPGRHVKYLIETPEDAEKYLSLPEYLALPKVNSYWALEKKSGEQAMLMVGIDQAMYSIQRLMGSETFGYWLYDHRELLHLMIRRSFRYLKRLVRHYLENNLGDAYGWVGPELCIPPLASVTDFYDFVVRYDREIASLIHEFGKLVWVHCHGDMSEVLKGFIELGVDCLNPIEPPPVGRITLAEAKEICSGRMALEGNVEDGAFDCLKPEQMKALVAETINQGKPGGGFILCPTSSPTTWPKLPAHVETNYRVFVETAVTMRDY